MAEAKAAGFGGPLAGGGVPGGRGRPVWVSSQPSSLEMEALSRRYPEVVAVPEETLVAESELWASSAVVARSLGRRVAIEAVIRELRRRSGMKGEISGSYVDKGLFVLRFSEPAERDKALSSPWTVAGQALALEAWRPRWFPAEDAVSTALVWVRLPSLPVEYWARESLRLILKPAGELVAADHLDGDEEEAGVCSRLPPNLAAAVTEAGCSDPDAGGLLLAVLCLRKFGRRMFLLWPVPWTGPVPGGKRSAAGRCHLCCEPDAAEWSRGGGGSGRPTAGVLGVGRSSMVAGGRSRQGGCCCSSSSSSGQGTFVPVGESRAGGRGVAEGLGRLGVALKDCPSESLPPASGEGG